MKKIEVFERAIEEKAMNLEEYGINSTMFWAYCNSKTVGNDQIDLDDVIWEEDIEAIVKTLRENDIHEFTISCTFSNLIDRLAAFEKHGFKMTGLTEVKVKYTDWLTGEYKVVPAIRMVG